MNNPIQSITRQKILHDRAVTTAPMQVLGMRIENFKDVQLADLEFDGLSWSRVIEEVGTATICDALDLVLGPKRLERFPPVEEHDFYNSEYLAPDGVTPKPLVIEVVLANLNAEAEIVCRPHMEPWPLSGQPGATTTTDAPRQPFAAPVKCLRLRTIARYDPLTDEFDAQTYFVHSPDAVERRLDRVGNEIKHLFGPHFLLTTRRHPIALTPGNDACTLDS